MLYGGSGFIYLWPSVVILCIFPLLAFVLLPHLKRAIESHKYEKLNKLQQLSFIIRREYWAISTSYAVLLVLMGGIFVYGLLYNYMYAPNIVTDVPVAVVDNSHSELSRNFIRWLDATPQAEIYDQAMDYHEAKEWMKAGKVQGILYLPHDLRNGYFVEMKLCFLCMPLPMLFSILKPYKELLHV